MTMTDPAIAAALQTACRSASDGGAPCIMVRTESRFDAYMDAIKKDVIPSGMNVTVVPDVDPNARPPGVAGQIVLGVWREGGKPQGWITRRFGGLPMLGDAVR